LNAANADPPVPCGVAARTVSATEIDSVAVVEPSGRRTRPRFPASRTTRST